MAKPDQNAGLEHEIEQTRLHLAETIDQLLYRTSPKTIANRQLAAAKAVYVDPETGEPKRDALIRTAAGVVGFVALVVVLRKLSGSKR